MVCSDCGTAFSCTWTTVPLAGGKNHIQWDQGITHPETDDLLAFIDEQHAVIDGKAAAMHQTGFTGPRCIGNFDKKRQLTAGGFDDQLTAISGQTRVWRRQRYQ